MAYGSEIEKLERRWMENPQGVSFAPLAEAYRRAGDQHRALEVLAIGLANHPAYVPALIVQARCHLDAGDDAAAEESFLAVVGTDGHNLIARQGLAAICLRAGREAEARGHLERVLEADPTHEEARAQLEQLAVPADGAGTAPSPVAEVDEAPGVPAGFEPTATTEDPSSVASAEDEPLVLEQAVDIEIDVPAGPADPEGGSPPDSLLDPEGHGTEPSADGELVAPEPPQMDHETGQAEAPSEAAWQVPDLAWGEAPDVPFEEELSAAWLDEALPEATEAVEPSESVESSESVEIPESIESSESIEASEPEITEPAASASAGFEEPPVLVGSEPSEPADAPQGLDGSSPEALAREDEDEDEDTPPVEDERGAADSSPLSAAAADDEVVADDAGRAGTDWEPIAEAGGEPVASPGPVAEEPSAVELATTDGEAWLPARDDAPTGPAGEETAEKVEAPSVTADSWPYDVSPSAEDDASAPAPEVAAAADAPLEAAPSEEEAVELVAGAEEEAPSDPEPEIEPALVITETMARVFERQGHRTMALAVYQQLAEQDPGNRKLEASIRRLGGEIPRGAGSDPEPAEAPRIRLDAAPTRPAEDLLSLGAVFGSGRPAPPGSPPQAEPSFDEFFGDASVASGGGPGGGEADPTNDLEQFTSWLRSLKR